MGDRGPSVLNKLTLNNFMVKNRPLARQGKDHVIKKLIRNAKKLREKKTDSDKQKEKYQRKADRLLGEVKVLKHLHPDDVMKFALLNKKPFAAIGNNPEAKIEERALCRFAEHKGISTTISKFREQYTNWSEDIPVFIKGLGVRHRDKKLKKLKRLGKLESFLQKEQQYLKLLQELTNIDIDPKILRDATSATKKIEKKQTSSRNRKRKREKKMNSESLKVVKRRKEERNLDQVDKGNGSGVGKSGKEEDNDKVNTAMENKDNEKVVEKMTEENSESSTMSDDDSHESDNIDSENDDSCADGSESEHRDNGASTINGENESDNEDSNESDDEPSDYLSNRVKQDLQNHKISVDRNSESTDESDSEDQSDCSDDENKRMPVKKSNVNSKFHIVSKIDKASGTAEVKQLDLRNISEPIQGNGDHKDMDSDDEDFFFGKTEPKKAKKSRKRSNFFLGSGKDDEESEDDELTDDCESDNNESALRSSHSDAVDSDDNGVVDTSKYFKRNLYRNSDELGRGGNRRQGDRGQGRNRGQRWDRGHRGQRGDRGHRGHRGRGGGNRNNVKGKEEDNGEKVFMSENVNRDLGYKKDNRKCLGRGYRNEEERKYRRGGRRGESQRPGTRRGRSHVDEVHSRGFPRGKRFSRSSNLGPQDQRVGSKSRRSGAGGRFNKQLCWQSDSSNPNMIPLPERKDGPVPPVKGEAAPRGHLLSLHPSWRAKLREKEQSASINQFKGKRMVFD